MDTHINQTRGVDGTHLAPFQQFRSRENPFGRPRSHFLQSLLTQTTPGATLAIDRVFAPAFPVGRVDFLAWPSPYDFNIRDLSRSLGLLDLDGCQPRDSDESAGGRTSKERNFYHTDDVNDGTNSCSNLDLPPSANTRSHHRQGSDGEGSPPRGRQLVSRSFNPYGPPKSTREINTAIKELLLRCHFDADEGFIYGFQHPDDVAFGPSSSLGRHKWAQHLIKIGRSKNHQTRMKQIRKQCRYDPHTVFAHFMPRHGMVERVVHTQLHNLRLRDIGCVGCGSRHEEWFHVDVRHAEDIVELWKAFTEYDPYDEQGALLPVWRERLEQLDLDDADCWQRFIREAPSADPVARPAVGSPQELDAENSYVGLSAGHIDPSSDGVLWGDEQQEDCEVI